jgi:P-type Ca2+ transporter type 2C
MNELGLTQKEVVQKRMQFGSNNLHLHEERVLTNVLKEIVTEPMFILLLVSCIIYFIADKIQEGIIMLVSIFIVAGISIYQEFRSRNAVQALNKLSQARVTVIRDGKEEQILNEDLVVDDIMIIEEGEIIGSDALIIYAKDFSVNESILTGESFSVFKNLSENIYRSTLVTSGLARARVTAVGNNTEFGKIGQSVRETVTAKTPLQLQIRNFVTKMVWVGSGAFLLVIVFNYIKTGNLMQSFLHGLTLAMSVLPEEIPVAFSTFQALGAFRLLKNNIIVKQPQYVETLGAATVICVDKTGTITQNKMSVAAIFDMATKTSILTDDMLGKNTALFEQVIEYAMWSSETSPFDPMEIAVHKLYSDITSTDKRKNYEQIHEYPIGGLPPIMTHIFKVRNTSSMKLEEYIIAAKGAVERILKQSDLPESTSREIEEQVLNYTKQGYRVLGVGKGIWEGVNWPIQQDLFKFEFLGLIAFEDPPKDKIKDTLRTFQSAGISVKMITGDHKETAIAIAKQIELQGTAHQEITLQGNDIMRMSQEELRKVVGNVNIYSRMFPDAKLRVIKALQENGEVVAMTGDGVNDAPALKAAHIGIAMGQRGSEVAKGAASLILADDDLAHMTEAVAMGRKIYDNLKKAIQYIVSIHIPIILIVTLPLLLNWEFTEIFSPVHVIFLELIMGPTCSIIYENEPMESGTMSRPPRAISNTFFNISQLITSILQGLVITLACLGIGYWGRRYGNEESFIRTLIFITLLLSNIFLTLINRSFYYSVFTTIRYKNNLVPLIITITLIFIIAVLNIPLLRDLFQLHALNYHMLGICFATAFFATFWIEPFRILRTKP